MTAPGIPTDAFGVRDALLSTAALVVGVMIVVVKLATDGLSPSFVLALGLLLIADGVLRLLTRRHDRAP